MREGEREGRRERSAREREERVNERDNAVQALHGYGWGECVCVRNTAAPDSVEPKGFVKGTVAHSLKRGKGRESEEEGR
jgi:hypothetical protein